MMLIGLPFQKDCPVVAQRSFQILFGFFRDVSTVDLELPYLF